MKAVTVRQPFANLIVTGRKRLETRRWTTSYRGLLLIHAARAVHNEPIAGMTAEGLPLGAIVGMVDLKGCHANGKAGSLVTPDEWEMGFFGPGWFAWELGAAAAFDNPIPCIGKLDLWTPPESVLQKVKERLASNGNNVHSQRVLSVA